VLEEDLDFDYPFHEHHWDIVRRMNQEGYLKSQENPAILADLEKKRLEEEQKKKDEEARLKAEEDAKKLKEEERIKEEARLKALEDARLLKEAEEKERLRLVEEKKKKQAEKAKKKAEELRLKAEADAKLLASILASGAPGTPAPPPPTTTTTTVPPPSPGIISGLTNLLLGTPTPAPTTPVPSTPLSSSKTKLTPEEKQKRAEEDLKNKGGNQYTAKVEKQIGDQKTLTDANFDLRMSNAIARSYIVGQRATKHKTIDSDAFIQSIYLMAKKLNPSRSWDRSGIEAIIKNAHAIGQKENDAALFLRSHSSPSGKTMGNP
jgi:hypothetical protein